MVYAYASHRKVLIPNEEAEPSLLETFAMVPDDTNLGPTYMNSVWPDTDLKLLVDIAKIGSTSKQSHEPHIVQYSGSSVTIVVPSNVLQVHAYAYGAGGYSINGPEAFRGSNGTFVSGAISLKEGRTFVLRVGQGGGYSPAATGLHGGLTFNEQQTLGGGSTSIYNVQTSKYVLLAAGGGSGSLHAEGISEIQTTMKHFYSGSIGSTMLGQNSPDLISGAGGSGVQGGTSGTKGFSGASGTSLVPKNGFKSSDIQKHAHWNSNVGLGTSFGTPAKHGLLVLQFRYEL
jgi:hypothetical protein